MADPEVDHGFVDDANGRTNILRSPFFDPYPGWDLTVDDYINRISYQLARSIEEHLPSGCWTIVGRRPPSPPPTPPSPSPRIVGAVYLGLISFIQRNLFPLQKSEFPKPSSPLSSFPTRTPSSPFLQAHSSPLFPPLLAHGHPSLFFSLLQPNHEWRIQKLITDSLTTPTGEPTSYDHDSSIPIQDFLPTSSIHRRAPTVRRLDNRGPPTTLTASNASFAITKDRQCRLPWIDFIPCVVLPPPPTLDVGECLWTPRFISSIKNIY
ncbi:hypothetical protein M5K25_013610 [Dendrobium thyrsiflorum]|uniref:Uncharacterized protein n=1 Tax=Dendrobium thyrsiflorum TaxID=117978 RepID=A0ABD0UTR1_DENTH